MGEWALRCSLRCVILVVTLQYCSTLFYNSISIPSPLHLHLSPHHLHLPTAFAALPTLSPSPPPPFFSPTHLSLYHTESSGNMPYGKVPTSNPESKDNTQMSKQCTQFTTVPTPSVLANPLRRHRRPLQTPGKSMRKP